METTEVMGMNEEIEIRREYPAPPVISINEHDISVMNYLKRGDKKIIQDVIAFLKEGIRIPKKMRLFRNPSYTYDGNRIVLDEGYPSAFAIIIDLDDENVTVIDGRIERINAYEDREFSTSYFFDL